MRITTTQSSLAPQFSLARIAPTWIVPACIAPVWITPMLNGTSQIVPMKIGTSQIVIAWIRYTTVITFTEGWECADCH